MYERKQLGIASCFTAHANFSNLKLICHNRSKKTASWHDAKRHVIIIKILLCTNVITTTHQNERLRDGKLKHFVISQHTDIAITCVCLKSYVCQSVVVAIQLT